MSKYAVVLLTPPAGWKPKTPGELPPDIVAARFTRKGLSHDRACQAAHDHNAQPAGEPHSAEVAAVVNHSWQNGSSYRPLQEGGRWLSCNPIEKRHAVLLLRVPGWRPTSAHGIPPKFESARFMVRGLRFEAACDAALAFNLGQLQFDRLTGEWAAPVRDVRNWQPRRTPAAGAAPTRRKSRRSFAGTIGAKLAALTSLLAGAVAIGYRAALTVACPRLGSVVSHSATAPSGGAKSRREKASTQFQV